MTESEQGPAPGAVPAGEPHDPADGKDGAAFARPNGVAAGFAPRPVEPAYSPPPPTVSPAEQAMYGKPPGAEAFAPLPGERLSAQPAQRPVVAWQFEAAFRGDPAAAGRAEGFDPPHGSRLDATPEPESAWWKKQAHLDPWRDPAAPYWLGRGAVYARGAATQLPAEQDCEQDPDAAVAVDAEATDEPSRGGVRHLRLGWRAWTLGVVLALLLGAAGGGVGYWLADTSNGLHDHDVHIAQAGKPANRPPGSVAAIAAKVSPAVVSIAIDNSTEAGVGSGVVISKDGYILTNNHVVAPVADSGSILVTFSDGDTASAKIVGRDAVSDLAVIKVAPQHLTVATLGHSSSLEVGDPVIAIGSPLGLQGTVTAGIVSALNRPVHVYAESGTSDAYLDAIQTDAAINPGNSGGALVDASGTVVGINSANSSSTGQTSVSGIGYAIPIDYAKTVAEQLISTGHAVHGSLGAQGRSVIAGLQEGVYLEQVTPGGPAAKAGLKPGDVITSADGRPLQEPDALVVAVQDAKPGDVMTFTVLRGNQTKTVKVTLGKA